MRRAEDVSIEVAAEADMADVRSVRYEVFVEEQQVPVELEYDDLDATSVHVLARAADGTPLGTGRLIHGPQALAETGREGVVLLGRLAVRQQARGTGLGVALVRAIEAAGRERGGVELELHAQVQALGFYERLGYVAFGEEYPDAGIPHRSMTKRLA
ncbi:GNAT family N-acetyltransferase [Streptacidiphilus jiangxiensis]|uniref:Predicted N-acyltransferase, GNAT family n=1 Tax=Streptacidiphilus jiangxiensis TaxID=235985 RepID=A0A1H7SM97_STRJI|nr:Predicted N-acyltransferase, GNAT family [Streptacidiphilus jiangxiensis]